jgi:hypothetical protein
VEASADVKIFSLMDLFDSKSEALSALISLPSLSHSGLHLSYQTWSEYMQGLIDGRVKSAVSFATQQKFPVTSMFSRHNPVRPQMRAFGSRRGFSTMNTATNEATPDATAQPKDGAKPKGKFFEFIQKIDQLDRKVDTPAATATSSAANDYDLADIEISFDKVSRLTETKAGAEGTAADTEAAAVVGAE